MHDIVHAFRLMRKGPVFSAVTVLVLAFAIGSNLTVFGLVDSLFMRPLLVGQPKNLVQISSLTKDGRFSGLSSQVLKRLRSDPVFGGVCGFTTRQLATDINSVVRSTGTLAMTGDCFTTLGLHTQIGRPFSIVEDTVSADPIVVLTDSFWRSAFSGSADVIGRKIHVHGGVFTIIGVTEPEFAGLVPGLPTGLVIPLMQTPVDVRPSGTRPIYFLVNIFARKADSVSEQQLQARLSTIERPLMEESVPLRYNGSQKQDYLARKLKVLPLRTGLDARLRERYGQPLYAMLCICGMVLLVSCVNVASLLLARGLGRRRELAVRVALGANRAAIIRLLGLESLLLVATGASVGGLFSAWTTRVLIFKAQELLDLSVRPSLDWRMVVFLLIVVGGVACGFTAVSAWQIRRFDVVGNLKESGRGVAGSNSRSQNVLLGLQVALTLALVAGSGVFGSSLDRLYKMDLGMKTRGLCEAMLARMPGGDTGPSGPYYLDLLREIENLSGVSSAALSDYAPLWTASRLEPVVHVESGASKLDIRAQSLVVSARFFQTLGVPIVSGAGFRPDGAVSPEAAAIVSKSLAVLLGGDRIIGEHIRLGEPGQDHPLQVIGVAGNAQLNLENPNDSAPLVVYTNLWQHPEKQRNLVLLVGGTGSSVPGAPLLRRMVGSKGREYIEDYTTLDNARDMALIENRLIAYVSTAFGAFTLILVAAGLFGLLTYHVNSRRKEIGIRLALGATRLQIRWHVVRQVMPVMLVGIVAGVVLALILGRVIGGLVYGVSMYDPLFLATSVGVLISTAILAAWIPAQKASSGDPLVTLREE